MRFVAFLEDLDDYLLSVPTRVRVAFILITLVSMVATALPMVPRAAVDLSRLPLVGGRIQQPETFGPDTIADLYEARVVRHDLADMYTKTGVEQTPLEAATWSREASSPYPPATLFALAALSAIGDVTGVGLYGMVALLAVGVLGASLILFWRTRWYLFPLLYLDFSYFGERFFFVQDGSYLVMLTVIMAALFVARRRPSMAHGLMAVAIAMKLSPLYYASQLSRMTRRTAVIFVAIVVLGLFVPYFVWENYAYIFQYNNNLKGDLTSTFGALAVAVPFTWLLWVVQRRGGADVEDAIGWSLVPVGLFLAIKMNAARHLLLLLLVPDKRGLRNVAAGVGLLAHYLAPAWVPVNGALPVAAAILAGGLFVRLRRLRAAV